MVLVAIVVVVVLVDPAVIARYASLSFDRLVHIPVPLNIGTLRDAVPLACNGRAFAILPSSLQWVPTARQPLLDWHHRQDVDRRMPLWLWLTGRIVVRSIGY